jgi:hypothetical protein
MAGVPRISAAARRTFQPPFTGRFHGVSREYMLA